MAWSLVLLLLLLKMKQLVSLAMARQDVWEQCRRDVEAAKKYAWRGEVTDSECVLRLMDGVESSEQERRAQMLLEYCVCYNLN